MMAKLFEIIKSETSWQGIHKQLVGFNGQSDKSAGRLFEEFCKYYYLAEPAVKSDYKNVWLFRDVPYAVKSKIGLGQTDHGADLVLEGQDGSLTVVQCKFKNDQSSRISWTKDRLSNLFAEGARADYLIVFTNAVGIDKHSESKERLSIVTVGGLASIEPGTIEQIKSLAKGGRVNPVAPKKPRDYQNEAILNVLKGFEENDRGQLILPCGAGKTLVSLWIREALHAKHTLVVVPSLALLKQIKDEWAANSPYVPRICVCSEKDIDKGVDNIASSICDIGGKVSTDVGEIREFLSIQDGSIVYSTYQSLEKVSEAIKGSGFQFDLAICDEAHKTSGSKLSQYALIHLDMNVRVKKRLYMTATPRVLSDNLKGRLDNETVEYICDMGNADIYGHEFYRMSFKDAIDKGVLVDYKIVAIGVCDLEIKEALRERRYVSDDETIDEIANNHALDKFMNEYGSTHAITFHSSVKNAKKFQSRHKKYYTSVSTFHVNGAQSTCERKIVMEEFVRSSMSVITNARCLTEGVDVPAIDTVYFCDPKNSKIDIIQATGRALRRADHKGKSIGYIVVPIYHHIDENIDESISDSRYKNLLNIIRALSAHDDRLSDEIKRLKLGRGKSGNLFSHALIEAELDLIKFASADDALKESIFAQIVNKYRTPFVSFFEAREFVCSLGIKSISKWDEFCKGKDKPSNIPARPDFAYQNDGWISWGDWLGTGNIAPAKRVFHSFDEARRFLKTLNLKSKKEWQEYSKGGGRPVGIPAAPDRTYKNAGWISWADWLGTESIAPQNRVFISFYDAREFVRSLDLKTKGEWNVYCRSGKKPENIPSCPNEVYENDGWISMGDWLGNGIIASINRVF
ncbi:MAG: DEAD/DEAH box helicase family protein, partial [Gammaproteobacteria bacterium]